MKKSILYLLACLLLMSLSSMSVEAQDTEIKLFNNKKTEVNIAVANIFSKSNNPLPYYYLDGDYYSYFLGDYYPQPELVVGLKFHNNKGAFRLSTSLNYSNITHEDQNGPSSKYTIKNFGNTINLGYEWHSTFNRVNVYYGFDVSSRIKNIFLENEYTNSYSGSIVKNENKINEFSIGINPLLGVNVFVTPNLSIGTEFKFITEYVTGKSDYISTSTNPESDETKISGFRTRFGPLGFISVNIHF